VPFGAAGLNDELVALANIAAGLWWRRLFLDWHCYYRHAPIT
jgi:hypothetical protein